MVAHYPEALNKFSFARNGKTTPCACIRVERSVLSGQLMCNFTVVPLSVVLVRIRFCPNILTHARQGAGIMSEK